MEIKMHPITCTCPSCRQAAGEFELYGAFETGEILSENEELELAMELLSVQHEQELEQFLGSLVKSVGRGLKSVGAPDLFQADAAIKSALDGEQKARISKGLWRT